MAEKTLILDAAEFEIFKKTRWKSNSKRSYNICASPDRYPCIAIEEEGPDTGAEVWVSVGTYVYLDDFPIGYLAPAQHRHARRYADVGLDDSPRRRRFLQP